MPLIRCLFLHLAVAVVAASAAAPIAWGEVYPSRPIAIVVPFPAGGPIDTLARIMADRMKVSLGQPVIVENVPGAGGTFGLGRVARATPDGYTASIGDWTSHVASGAIYPIQFDLLRDFEPVSLLTSSPQVIVGKSALPFKDLKDLIAWLKANPDKASAATVGPGSTPHICGIYFQNNTGTRFQLVPYRGGAQAMQDLVGGHVDFMCAEASQTLPHVRGGKMKAYAVLAKSRWTAAPETPTIDEAGVPGLYISSWRGLWVPRGTSKEVIAKLNAAVVDALADPAARQRLFDLGHEIFPREQQTPEALGAHHKAEIGKWWPIIKAADIKVE